MHRRPFAGKVVGQHAVAQNDRAATNCRDRTALAVKNVKVHIRPEGL